jgi:hypothetical protein
MGNNVSIIIFFTLKLTFYTLRQKQKIKLNKLKLKINSGYFYVCYKYYICITLRNLNLVLLNTHILLPRKKESFLFLAYLSLGSEILMKL